MLHCSAGENPGVPLAKLLTFLYKNGSVACMVIWFQLLRWTAWAIEQSDLLAKGSLDPEDLPAPRGNRRSRKIHPRYRGVLAKMAGVGSIVRSGSKAARLFRWARRRSKPSGVADSTGNMAMGVRAKWYREDAKDVMHHSKTRIYSVAFDGARVGNKDRFYSGLYSADLDIACWGDPMAFFPAKAKTSFSPKLKTSTTSKNVGKRSKTFEHT